MFAIVAPVADDRKLTGVLQAGPGFALKSHAPATTGAAAPSLLVVRSAGTVAVRYNWMLLLLCIVLVPATRHSPDVALMGLHCDVVIWITSGLATVTVACVNGETWVLSLATV